MTSVAELLRQRARDLTRHLASAIKGDTRGVHQGRVASRRLRESLPVAGRGRQTAKTARRSFREITRALGPVRELDVALEHLEDVLQSDEPAWGIGGPTRRGARRGAGGPAAKRKIPRIAIERVRAHVLSERERRRDRMLARLDRVDVDAAVSRVERIAGGAARFAPGASDTLAARVRARAFGLQMSIEKAGTLYHPDRLHAIRIAAKKLRYALEVAAAAAIASVAADIRLLKRAQETLGVMHDYQVLLEHVAAVSDATPKGTPGAAGLRAMAAAYDRECRKLHAIYLKMAPGLTASAARLRNLKPKARQSKQ